VPNESFDTPAGRAMLVWVTREWSRSIERWLGNPHDVDRSAVCSVPGALYATLVQYTWNRLAANPPVGSVVVAFDVQTAPGVTYGKQFLDANGAFASSLVVANTDHPPFLPALTRTAAEAVVVGPQARLHEARLALGAHGEARAMWFLVPALDKDKGPE
jgi:hypothetical protein